MGSHSHPSAQVFSFGTHESCGELIAVAELVATTPIYTLFSVPGRARAKICKKARHRAIRYLLASGTCRYRGREHKGRSDVAQLAPEDLLARVHDALEHNSSDTRGGKDGGLCQKHLLRNFPREPRRQHSAEHGLGVFQYNCESLREPNRLYELMALAKRKGATIAC